ncbi:MAG: DNA-directed RNA polymerase, subunit E'' [Nitrososphaerota archaeon]|jgi:DNA-directed RNA polymerase subunit E"|nr:DNA-directed RNA polymerase, subunit E'' [Nitrososphaerota archaeon]MDG6979240.1 DNA-directed RNA polymerase, subunit E'' [Nitrososphaerota archaeon]MDG7021416.1 DNA-directed RNA polymerase, subunit E'' [Nitrososphaerota archaeon]
MARELACRKCHMLTHEKACPNDKSNELSSEWSGLIIVLDVARSNVAQTLGITVPGRYALKVS